MRTVVYSTQASDELEEIFAFIARDDGAAARRVLVRLRTIINGLGDFATSRPALQHNVFLKVAAGLPYVITYEIDEADQIVIIRIRHTSRDFPR